LRVLELTTEIPALVNNGRLVVASPLAQALYAPMFAASAAP
jgi:hypothetical protein